MERKKRLLEVSHFYYGQWSFQNSGCVKHPEASPHVTWVSSRAKTGQKAWKQSLRTYLSSVRSFGSEAPYNNSTGLALLLTIFPFPVIGEGPYRQWGKLAHRWHCICGIWAKALNLGVVGPSWISCIFALSSPAFPSFPSKCMCSRHILTASFFANCFSRVRFHPHHLLL